MKIQTIPRTHSRRQILKMIGMGMTSVLFPLCTKTKKTHIMTLSFDDGFKKSSLKTAEIYEKYGLSACINVIASAHLTSFKMPNVYHRWPAGDFQLWNELQERGHEIMPHGYMHANLSQMPFNQGKDLIISCLDMFSKELKGFEPEKSVFNFPFNASTPELEDWLPTQIRAFRTGGQPINDLPHKGKVKLTCTSFGPGNIDHDLKQKIDDWLSKPSGWLIYNTHGLDDEGWGPLSSTFLDDLLNQLSKMKSVSILPAGQALANVMSI